MVVFDELRTIGAPLVALFAGLAVIRSVVRQDLAELGKLLFIRLPLALVGSAIASKSSCLRSRRPTRSRRP